MADNPNDDVADDLDSIENPDPEPEEPEDDPDEWHGYRPPRRHICIDRTGGRFPGF